jgi:RNA polymerase sigma factor (sigma-70 family)
LGTFSCVTWTIDNAIVAADNDFLFEQYLRDSFAGLVARLRNTFSERVAAEDLVQEALIRAWQLDARGEQIRSLEPWMTAVATNLARSRWRTIHAEDRALEKVARDRSSDPSDSFQVTAASSLPGPLECAIGQLSPRQGQIVALHYYGDLSQRAIASRLDVSEGTVKRTLHDARAQLRRMVGQHRQLQPRRRQTMMGWHMAGSHPRQYEHALAGDTTYEGKRVAELRCLVPRADGFGTFMQTFSAERFLEQRVRFSGALQCKGVADRVGLWMRVDGPGGTRPLAFDNMADRPVRGTTDWEHHEVVLDVPAQAQAIAFGVLLSGEGEVRMSDFHVEIVGPDVPTTDSRTEALPDRPQNLDLSQPLTEKR